MTQGRSTRGRSAPSASRATALAATSRHARPWLLPWARIRIIGWPRSPAAEGLADCQCGALPTRTKRAEGRARRPGQEVVRRPGGESAAKGFGPFAGRCVRPLTGAIAASMELAVLWRHGTAEARGSRLDNENRLSATKRGLRPVAETRGCAVGLRPDRAQPLWAQSGGRPSRRSQVGGLHSASPGALRVPGLHRSTRPSAVGRSRGSRHQALPGDQRFEAGLFWGHQQEGRWGIGSSTRPVAA